MQHVYTYLDKFDTPDSKSPFRVATIPKFVITNVSDFFFHHEKEYWLHSDFPYPRPPFDKLWVEYEMPLDKLRSLTPEADSRETQELIDAHRIFVCGVVVKALPNNVYDSEFIIRADVVAFPRYGETKMSIIGGPIDMAYSIKDGIASDVKFFGDFKRDRPMISLFHPILMAFSFSSCRNIEIIRVEASKELNKARVRKGKPAIAPHHVINILPFGKVFRSSTRTVVSDDGKIDVVIRRGSFARYGAAFNRGLLFGKYEGIFWRPAINLDPAHAPEYAVQGLKK